MGGDRNGKNGPALVLFRWDLRVADNGALAAAAESGRQIVPVFIFDQESQDIRPIGAARRWWLHHSLTALSASLDKLGATLVLRSGPAGTAVDALIGETGAGAVYFNRSHVPAERAGDDAMTAGLQRQGLRVESFDGQLLHDPDALKTGGGQPYRVYTPFYRKLMSGDDLRHPVDQPTKLRGYSGRVKSDDLAGWKLLPTTPDWAGGLAEEWTPGEAGAQDRLRDLVDDRIDGYGEGRDLPAAEATSRLSPHLANGEITPAQILAALGRVEGHRADVEIFRKEIAWREFNYHLLWHNPDMATRNYDPKFDRMTWAGARSHEAAWQTGRTGYPIVDAGMRQMWITGWMQNRVRMITASFLIKHLLIDWRDGEKWFWDCLVDADPANNAGNWQWVAGSGADASPFFRIFNPILQGRKFDGRGVYVRHYVPEITKLSDKWLHEPWRASKSDLATANVKLGETYPVPVIDHAAARERALQTYRSLRGN